MTETQTTTETTPLGEDELRLIDACSTTSTVSTS